MAARICPRCSERVDERQAKTSPFCLRCGAPLGAPTPTFSGKPAQSGGSALPWILGGIGVVVVLGVVAVIALLVAIAPDAPAPVATATADPNGGGPKVEVPTATPSVASAVPSVTGAAAKTVASPRIPTPPSTVPTVPTVTRVDSGVLGPFPRAKAQNEVDKAGGSIASCKRAAGPFGVSSIRVDFEPDGRVGTLTRPPFAGTPEGSCISARFLAIRIGAFQGSTQSIEHQFIIQD